MQELRDVSCFYRGCRREWLREEYADSLGKAMFQQSAVLDPDSIAVDLQSKSQTVLSDLEAGKEVLQSAERNLRAPLELVDECVLFDNSDEFGHRIVGLKFMGMPMLPVEPLPRWAELVSSSVRIK